MAFELGQSTVSVVVAVGFVVVILIVVAGPFVSSNLDISNSIFRIVMLHVIVIASVVVVVVPGQININRFR